MQRVKNYWYALTACIVSFFVYLLTLAPSITFNDSGELITAAYHLGIAHPPGFPFWALLAHVFTYIPFGSVAWRVNVSSAVFASLATACLSVLFFNILPKKQNGQRARLLWYGSAITSALLFAFTKTLWSQSVVAEVYSLTILLVVLQFLSLIMWKKTEHMRYLYMASLMYGLSIATHYLVLTLAPAYMLWVFMQYKSIIRSFRYQFILLLFFLAGISAFVYIPLRAAQNQPMNWGNIETLQDSADHIRRKQFAGGFKFDGINAGIYLPPPTISNGQSFFSRIVLAPAHVAVVMGRVFTPVLALIGGIGMFLLYRHSRKTGYRSYFWLVFLCFAISTFVFDFILMPVPFTTHDTGTLFIEHLIPLMIFSLYIGYGLYWLALKISSYNKYPAALALLLYLLPIAYLIYANYQPYTMRGNTVAYDHGMNILATVDENAIIFVDKNDWLFPVLYLSMVEGVRPDVMLYDRTGNVFEDVYKFSETPIRSDEELEQHRTAIEKAISSQNPNRPVYYAADKNFDNTDRDVLQEGILYKQAAYQARTVDFNKEYANIMNITENKWGDNNTAYILAYYRFRLADQLLSNGKTDEALSVLESIPDISKSSYLIYTQLGTYYYGLLDYERANSAYQEALELNPYAAVARRNLDKLTALQNNHEVILAIEQAINNQDCSQAQDLLGTVDTAHPSLPMLMNNTGVCWARKEKYDKARAAWETTLDIDPSYENARENLERLNQELL
ncbi:MAG TPA: DUF2723 domain-containing protein [Patescibacteria group bacterium]|nr:DUF2723 domain-containing protein [Patescibacteria group bacterium]